MFSDGGKWGNLYYYGLQMHIKGKKNPSVIQTERNQQIHRALDGKMVCSRLLNQEDSVQLPTDTFFREVDDTIRMATQLPK